MKSFSSQSPHVVFSETSDNRNDQKRSTRIVPQLVKTEPSIPSAPEENIILSATVSGATAGLIHTVVYELEYTEGVTVDIEWRVYFNPTDGGGELS